jgi:GxxExxY protein
MALVTNPVAGVVIGAAMHVHSRLGPGLFESVYEECLAHELRKESLQFRRQVTLPLTYDGHVFPRAFIADLIVEDKVLVELKAIEKLLPVHSAQVITYLRITGIEKGFLLNFNAVRLKDGLKAFVLGRPTPLSELTEELPGLT